MRHYQESSLEFRRNNRALGSQPVGEYPVCRGVIVHMYGGTLEKCVDKARKDFGLDDGWELVNADAAKF